MLQVHQPSREPTLADYSWLVSDAARPYLELASVSSAPLVALTRALRRDLSPLRVHLVLQQADLRRRARSKFRVADRMFFTPKALEQATRDTIARYKASRLGNGETVGDLCCGIGGDLLALAERGPCVGVDREPVHALFARQNCYAVTGQQAEVQVADAEHVPVADMSAWHIDPDRRADSRRTTRVELFEPGLSVIERLLERSDHAAVKLAPATQVPDHWAESAELEWIGSQRECKQQVAWFGPLAEHTGKRAATLINQRTQQISRVIGEPSVDVPPTRSIGRYVFEPHATVLAAKLTGQVAHQFALARVAPHSTYLTGNEPIDHGCLVALAVVDAMPFDRRRLTRALRQHDIGQLEVKKSGARIDPDQVRRALFTGGTRSATLLLYGQGDRILAILATRIRSSDHE